MDRLSNPPARTGLAARVSVLVAAALLPLSLAGCFAHSGFVVEAQAQVQAPPPPSLVSIGTGVWVVEDYHEPVYFHGQHYWVYRSGVWYRSHIHTGAWVRLDSAPATVVRIHQPRRYVHYRGPRGAARRTIVVRGGGHRHRPRAHRHRGRHKDHRHRGYGRRHGKKGHKHKHHKRRRGKKGKKKYKYR